MNCKFLILFDSITAKQSLLFSLNLLFPINFPLDSKPHKFYLYLPMKLLIQDKNRKGVAWIFQILLQSLYEDLHPIIISGETGFPFLYFLDYSRRFNIPFSVTSKVLSGSAVNMHHVSDFLMQVKRLDKSHFPIFVDYTRHFLDENVNDQIVTSRY